MGPSGTQSAPSAPKEHFGAQSSPILGEQFLPLYSCYQAHDLWVPKCTYCSKTRFERPNAFWSLKTIHFTSENIRAGALGSFWSEKSSNGATLATWSFLDEKVCTSVGNLPSRNAFEKSEDFLTFSKNKKVTKSHFRVLAYVYDVFCCSEGSESQSCVLSALEHFGAPKSPKSHFFIRVRRFCLF